MPIQEALVWSDSDLERPAGVLFDPPCTTADLDRALWKALIPDMARAMADGSYIMALIQTRNTRVWNNTSKQYDFTASEDYLVAAYKVSASIGVNYVAGSVARHWLDSVYANQAKGSFTPVNEMIQVFQCSAKGCNLSTVGLMKLINFYSKSGKSTAEAISLSETNIAEGAKFGWRGGSFPALPVSSRARSRGVTSRSG